jgi:RNA polymerase sigma-70 factor, ECF subfamily
VDEAIVRQAQQGSHDAFRLVVESSIDRLHAVASLIARDPTIAQDAVQEALVRAWRDLPKLREPKSVSSWLAQLTVRATYDQLRRQRRVRQLKPLVEDSAVGGDESGRSVDRILLAWAYDRLPPEQRAVVVLHYHLGLSLDEAATTLGIPRGTARSRLHAALQSMRRWMGPRGPVPAVARTEVAR